MILQVLLGVFLAAGFVTNYNLVFESLAGLQDGQKAALARGIHSIMTSVIFIICYSHILKPLIINTNRARSQLVWILGWIIFIILVIAAFLGYVLPLTQISFWGLVVFIKIINSVPFLGSFLSALILGGEFINVSSYSRVTTLHIVLPFIIILVLISHIIILHWNNSSDPLGLGGGLKNQTIFLIWFGLRDSTAGLFVFSLAQIIMLIFISIVAHEEGFQYFNPLVTPEKILPEWFFLSLFGVIKSISHQTIALGFAIICLLELVLNYIGRRVSFYNFILL